MSEFTTQGPAPSVSSLNGRFRWDQGSGLQQFGSTSLAVTPTEDGSDGTLIQETVDSISDFGGGVIFLRNGTYLMDSDIVLPSNTVLVGETDGGVIIDFQNQDYHITAEGTITTSEGTVAVTNLSTTVTGTGTTWDSTLIEQSINLGGIWYIIADVVSATEVTLSIPFELDDLAGASYSISDTPFSIVVSNLTVQNSTHTEGAVSFKNCVDITCEAVNFYVCTLGLNFVNDYLGTGNAFFTSECDIGVNVENCNSWTFEDFSVFASTGDNMVLDRLVSASISNFTNSSAGGNGVTIINSNNWGMYDFTLVSAADNGVELVGTDDIQIFSAHVQLCGADGIKLTSTSDRNTFGPLTLINNTGYGVNIAAATDDDNILSGNTYVNNTAGDYNDSGTGTVFIPSASGSGDVVGPSSVTDDNPVVFDGTTGKLIKQKTYAAFKTLLGLVKGDVGLGNVDNTSDATKNAASVTLTNKTITAPTVADFSNAAHDHGDADDGGVIVEAALPDFSLANVSIANPYKFHVYRAAAQNTTSGVFAKVSFDTESFDTNNNFATGTYTVPVSGFYHFTSVVKISIAGVAILALYKNGSEFKRGTEYEYTAARAGLTISLFHEFAANDTIEIYVFDNSGSAIAEGSATCWFAGYLVCHT